MAETRPRFGEADFIGVGVLDNQPLQTFGFLREKAEADGAAIVLHIHAEVVKSNLVQKMSDDFGEFVKAVSKRAWVGRIAVAETWVIGRDDMEVVGQGWDQVAVLM